MSVAQTASYVVKNLRAADPEKRARILVADALNVHQDRIKGGEEVLSTVETLLSGLEAQGPLSARMVRVLRRRYGLGGFLPVTLAEIGVAESVSRARSEQIVKRALELVAKERPRLCAFLF